MELSPDSRPIFRFSMFEAFWQNKQKAIERYFPEATEDRQVSKWMTFGSAIAELLEARPLDEFLAKMKVINRDNTPSDVPLAYDVNEYRIIEDIDGFLVRGTLDSFEHERCKFLDNKATKEVWSANKVQGHVQLDFYSLLVQVKHGKVDDVSHIVNMPVAEDENGIVRLTGVPAVATPHITTQEMRDAMRERIINTAKEMTTLYEAYKAGNLKLN